jgi:hypothetical protein
MAKVSKKTLGAALVMGILLSPCSIIAADWGEIHGRVIDVDTGEPLPLANIIIQGTTLGDATDADGSYVISRGKS